MKEELIKVFVAEYEMELEKFIRMQSSKWQPQLHIDDITSLCYFHFYLFLRKADKRIKKTIIFNKYKSFMQNKLLSESRKVIRHARLNMIYYNNRKGVCGNNI